MKLNKESIKQISLILTGILLIGVGYFNYSLDLKENNDNEIAKIKLPCVLIDVPVCKFNKYLTKEKRGVSVDSNVMKMKSIHSPKENNEMFYFSKEISDYYADDFNTYIKRTPQLQALKRCYSNKLMKMIKSFLN